MAASENSFSKSGRTKKSDEGVLYFGMKVTPQEKAKIKTLALQLHTTATAAVLKAVDLALSSQTQKVIPTNRRITADELIAMDKKTREKILREQAKLVARYDEVIED